MLWRKYTEIEAIRRLREEGRELLGQYVVFTEKRDGENVSLWLDENNEVHISSHNQEVADMDIQTRMKGTQEFTKVIDLLKTEKTQFRRDLIVYGELMKPVGPTRIEHTKKRTSWILFDIWDNVDGRFLGYTKLYQYATTYKLPIVKAVIADTINSMDQLIAAVDVMLMWCKKHRREGIVGKMYADPQTFFKEKIDIPKLPKLPKDESTHVILPPMPEDRIMRALQHAFDVVGEENWKNVKVAMPEVAKQLSTEAREHNFAAPRDMYRIYINTPVESLRPQPQSL